MRKISAFFLLLGIASGFHGCGYSLNHRVKEVFLTPGGIFVPVFDNATKEVGAERIFTNALIRELASRGEIQLTSRSNAALELKGKLRSIEITNTILTPLGRGGLQSYQRLPSELGVRVTVELNLVKKGTEESVWRETFAGFRRVKAPTDRTFDYEAPSSVGILTQSAWEDQYPEIARMIMRDVYDAMVGVF